MSTLEPRPLRTVLIGADSLLVECGEILLGKGHTIVVVAAGSPRVAAGDRGQGPPGRRRPGAGGASGRPPSPSTPSGGCSPSPTSRCLPDEVLALPAQGALNFHDGPLPGLRRPEHPRLGPAAAARRPTASPGTTSRAGIDEGDVVASPAPSTWPRARRRSRSTPATSRSPSTPSASSSTTWPPVGSRHPAGPLDAPVSTFSRHDRPAAMAVLDWRRPAAELDALVRALDLRALPEPARAPRRCGSATRSPW